jgi:flagellar basal-body rod protein FlgB
MISALFNQSNYVASKKMLDLTVMRHEALSSNLANVETPNYKRLDVAPTFTDQLQRAIAANDPDRISSIHAHLQVDDTAVASRRDGNTVELEKELIELNKNSMAHSMETQLIGGALKKLRLAITGRPS